MNDIMNFKIEKYTDGVVSDIRTHLLNCDKDGYSKSQFIKISYCNILEELNYTNTECIDMVVTSLTSKGYPPVKCDVEEALLININPVTSTPTGNISMRTIKEMHKLRKTLKGN